jgi:hypothetical protein
VKLGGRVASNIQAEDPMVVCPHCGARHGRATWLTLGLLDRVYVADVGWVELRRCGSCEHAIPAAAAEHAESHALLPTRAAARHCGLSISGLRQAARRGEIRPWTSSGGSRLLWRLSDLDRFLESRRGEG